MIDLRIDLRKDPDIQKLPEDVQTKLSDFIESIPKVKFFKPDGKPKKEWKVFYGDTWASARASARDSTRAFAWTSRDSEWASARDSALASARDSARGSACDSAMDFAMELTRASAKNFEWEAADDFSLKAEMITVSDLKYKNKAKHEHDVDKRIEVWKKGYGLLGDVDGVLYVYAKKGTKPLLS